MGELLEGIDFNRATGSEPAEPDTRGVLPAPEPVVQPEPAPVSRGLNVAAEEPTPPQGSLLDGIDFDRADRPVEVEEPTFRKITDPLGRPLKVQPPERQWSVFGTPLPGTEAAVMGAEIHPLSRAVLQNFDLTKDIPGNRAALKKILRGVYGPNITLNRAAPLPVDDLTDEQLAKYVELPQVQRALQKDSITRRRMAVDAEEAAILRGEIPLMLAAEGQVDTMMRMLMDPEQRSVAAQMAQQNRGVLQGIANIGTLGAIETIEGFKMKRAMGTQGVAEAARTNAWDTFVNAFTNQNFQGFIDSQYASGLLLGDLGIWTPLDLIYGAGAGIGKVLDVYRAGGFNEETAARLEQQAYKDFAAAVKTLRRAAAEYPSSARGANFMRQVEEAESDFAVFRLMFEDPAGAAAVTGEVFARNAPVLAASAATRGVIGPKTAMTVSTMGQFLMEDVRLDELRAAIVKEKTGHDLNTNVGIQAFLKDPDAQRIYSAYGTNRARAISLTQLLTFGIYRGGTFIPSSSLTAKLAERTVVSGALEGVGEGLAGLSATGELDVREAAVEAALGFGQGLPTTLIEGYVSGATDIKTAREARRAKEWLKGTQDLKGTIGGIDVVKLDTAASVLGEKLEDQGIDTVYITASELDRLDQDGALSETLGLDRDDVKQAAAEGDMVEVTASSFIRHILGADGFEALMEHTSYELGALTPAEAQQYEDAGIGDQIQQQIEDRARARMSPAIDDRSMEQLNTDMNDIRDQVAAQLEATGRYDAAKSRAFGLLTAQRYATRAIRITEETGQPIDARALFDADNLQITGRARVQPTITLEQPVSELKDVDLEELLVATEAQVKERPAGSLDVYPAAMPPEYAFSNYEAVGGRMVEFTPDQFLALSSDLPIDAEVRENADDLAQMMLDGQRVDPPYLVVRNDGVVDSHDGRHRALAAKQLGIGKIPVLLMGEGGTAFPSTIRSIRPQLGARDPGFVATLEQTANEFDISAEQLASELEAAGGDITQTPRFKEWFGDSKIVGDDGKPLVVYHGTSADIEAFDPTAIYSADRQEYMAEFGQAGMYFTADPNYAATYARGGATPSIYPVYLSLQNPLVIPEPTFWEGIKEAVTGRGDSVTATSYIPRSRIDELEAQGYDGIINPNSNEIIAFRPEQIKSQMNRGTFDPTSPLILEQEGASLFENPVPVTPTGKNNKILIKDIGQALTDDHMAQLGEQLFPEDNPDHFQQVLDMAIAEMDAQLERANSGVGWYDKDVNDAINTTAENLFPTLLTEPGHRDFFLILAGIFSNGTNPSQAWGMSAGAYEIFLEGGVVPVQRRNADGTPVKMTSYKDKKTGEQVTKPAGWGVRNGANEQHLKFFKHLVETQGGLQEAADWMLAEHTPAEINEMMLASGAFKAGKYKTKKELAGAPDRGVMVFGPKLGRYTMGLLGVEIDANDTTVDLWYTRTFRRWTGRLMDPPLGNEGVAAQPDPKNDEAERKSIFRLTEELSVRYGIGPGDVQAALWFFEKRLWATHGAQLDEGTNSQGAAKLLADRGIDVAERGDQPGAAVTEAALEQQAAGQQAARGGFTPADLITDQEGNPVNLLQIFEKADATTFLHESGHFWLEQLKADADAVKGQFDRDWSAVKDWWASRPLELREEAVRRAKKAKDKDAVAALQKMTEAQVATYARTGELRGEGTQRYLSVAMHEQFARGVENYFATGRAPSLSLADIFSKFRIWVSSVYARLAGAKLDVQFSPEVTAVIDRMLAADEEIALIEGQYALTPLYNTASEAGMTPTQFAEYQRKTADARNERRARQLSKHVKELQRTQTEKWKQAKERLLPEVQQEVAAQPAYRLLYALTQQGLADGSVLAEDEAIDRMDRALLKELLEAEGFSLDNIPRVDSKAIYEEGGVSPAIVATAFGYEDVDAMILDLVDREPYSAAVERAVETKLEEEFGSIELSGEADALASAHSEQTGRVLAMELEALRTTEPAFKQQFVRAYARQRLLDMPSAQVRPYRFLAAQNKHAKLAGIALKRGDRVEAYQHQFQRLVNHYMAAEALKAQRDIEKKTKYLRDFTRPGRKFNSFEYGYADSILRILAAVNFSQGAAGQQSRAAQINALQEFIEEKHAADGSILDVPAWLLDTSGGTANNIREMSYLQFLQLHETIKRYEQQARAAKKIRVGTEDQDREVAKAELLAALAGRDVSRVNKLRGKAASAGGAFYTAAAVTALADAQLLKVEALLEAIDGKPLGAWHQTIYEPFSQAAAQKYDLQAEVSQLVGELIEALPKDVRKSFGKPVDVGALGKPGMRMTRGNLIMLALNVGNESNLDKLIRGMGGDPDNSNVKSAGWNISEELIDTALEQLTEQEWDLVQAIWGHAEKLFPAVEAIYGREHGIAPDRVVPRTVKTKFGDIKGGYFPMMYDRTIAGVATDLSQKTALELIQAEVGRATINSSMTKARTGYAAPVDLDISRLALGLDNTIHFITHYEAVRNANKILGDKDVRAELESKVGLAYTDQLVKWVAALASNGNDSPPVDIIQKGIQQLYNNTTVAVLGFSYSTLSMQTLGLLNGQDRMLADTGYGPISIAEIQKDIAAGVAAAARPQHVQYVMEVSGEMRARRKSMDREVSQVLRNLAGKEGVLTGAQRFSMEAIAQVQFYTVDIPVWTAAYNRALKAEPGNTENAVRYADRVVRLSQSAGGLKDLAAVQRHKGLIKGLTMFYSFFSALYAALRGLGVEFTDNVRKNPVAATTRAATRVFVLIALQSVATGLIRDELPEMEPEDEDAQTLLRYVVAESAATALGTIPVVREIAAGLASGYGYNGGAGNIAFEAAAKSFQGVTKYIDEMGEEEFLSEDGDYEERARKLAPYILLGSVLFKLPGVQINRTTDGLAAYFDEADDWNWTDLVRGYSPERAERRQ